MPDDDANDPRHINQARAWHVAVQAEGDFEQSLGLNEPGRNPVTALLAALRESPARSPEESRVF